MAAELALLSLLLSLEREMGWHRDQRRWRERPGKPLPLPRAHSVPTLSHCIRSLLSLPHVGFEQPAALMFY